jgi:hypothetical protein
MWSWILGNLASEAAEARSLHILDKSTFRPKWRAHHFSPIEGSYGSRARTTGGVASYLWSPVAESRAIWCHDDLWTLIAHEVAMKHGLC